MQPAGAIGIDLPSQTTNAPAGEAMATIFAAASSSSTIFAAAAATSSPGNSPQQHDPGSEGECQLLGSFALFVQGALGALALSTLVYKRYRERPQRPLRIWFFDVSKQVFGSVLVHMANIFMSMLTSGRFSIKLDPGAVAAPAVRAPSDSSNVPNPCSLYLLNLGIDTTLGIPILILLLKVLTRIVAFTPLGKPRESIQSGHYGHPPNVWWWLKQSVIYFCGLFGMKICVLVIFLLAPWISKVGDWALGWTEGNEKLQIAFVMMIFPLIMNGLQYYIIDSFIKDRQTIEHEHEHERLPSEDPDPHACPRRLGTHHEDGDADDSDSDLDGHTRAPRRSSKSLGTVVHVDEEYDPDVDGRAPTVVGSGSSRGKAGRTKVPLDLYPKE